MRPRIIYYHMKDFYFDFDPSPNLFFGWFFLHFSTIFFSLYISTFCRMTSHFFLFASWHRHSFRDLTVHNFSISTPSVEGDPWSRFRKKIIKLKEGDYWITFSFSEKIKKDGYLSSQAQSLKAKSTSLERKQ